MSSQQMKDKGALFFYQLLFPLCNTSKSNIDSDPRKSFYTDVAHFSNQYVLDKGLFSGYGHACDIVKVKELVHWDGILFKHAAKWGACNIHCQWVTDNIDYDSKIEHAMQFSRYVQIKSIYKLNINKDCPQQGNPGYDPCAKYDFLYRVLVDNMNSITEVGSLKQCVDKTSWLHMGFGTEVLHRSVGNIGINKGGQTVMSFDAGLGHRYPQAYHHRHSLQPRDPPLTTEGEMEIKSMLD
eukprot:5250724-Ditylum_brightwellii.AAC.1